MLRKAFALWLRFARAVAAVNTTVLLSVIYLCVVTPIGLVMRLFNGSPLSSHPSPNSQWTPCDDAGDPRKPF